MEIVTTIAPIALALIMLGLGLGLTLQDFTRIVAHPKDFIAGFTKQSGFFSSSFFETSITIILLKTPT